MKKKLYMRAACDRLVMPEWQAHVLCACFSGISHFHHKPRRLMSSFYFKPFLIYLFCFLFIYFVLYCYICICCYMLI